MSHRHPRAVGVGATAVIAALLLAGCAPAADTRPSATGLIIAEPADTPELDPQTSYFDASWRIQDMVYDSLVTTNDKSEILPSLAESWEQDGTGYTFTLRDDVTFSNGRALVADDVVGSLNRILDPATGSYWAPQLGPVTAITAVDETTVRIDLASPYSPFLAALASTSAAILPMAELEAGTFDPAVDMLGTGPYVLDSHTQDQEWRLSANPAYRDPEDVQIDDITVKIVSDDAARVAGLRNGSIDIGYFANPDAPVLLEGVSGVDVTVQGSSDMYWLLLNGVAPDSPFVDQAQRQALATTIDRDALIAAALGGTGIPTATSPASLPDSCAPDGLPTYSADAAEAEALLAEAGLTAAEYSLIIPPGSPTYDAIGQYLQQDIDAAGFATTLETPEMGAYIDRVYVQSPGQFDAVIDYFSGFLAPSMALQNLLVDPENPTPLSGFLTETPGLSEALQTAVSSADPAEASAALQSACALVAEHANIVPLATKTTTIAVRTDRVDASIPAYDGYDVYLRNLLTYSLVG